MRPSNFPNRVRARREAALARREANLAAWTKGEHPDYTDEEWAARPREELVAHKIQQAESDIEHLKKKVA